MQKLLENYNFTQSARNVESLDSSAKYPNISVFIDLSGLKMTISPDMVIYCIAFIMKEIYKETK